MSQKKQQKLMLITLILLSILYLPVHSMRHMFLNWGDWKSTVPIIEMHIGSEKKRVRMKLDLSTTVTQVICQDMGRQYYNKEDSTTFAMVTCGDPAAPECNCEEGICQDKIKNRRIGRDDFWYKTKKKNSTMMEEKKLLMPFVCATEPLA